MKNWISVLVVSMCLSVMLCGCGQNPVDNSRDKSYSTVHHYFGTQAPGDVWSWTTENYTFSGSNETTGLYFSGKYSITSNGYMKATIESTSNNVNMPAGTIIYGLEIPGTMLIIKPGINNTVDRMIVCAAKAQSAQLGKFNCVEIPYKNWERLGCAGYLTFEVSAGYTFDVWPSRTDGVPVPGWEYEHNTGIVFNDGIYSLPGHPGKICIMESGVLVDDSGANSDGIIGLQEPDTIITSTDAANASVDYRGVLYQYTTGVGAGAGTAETHLIGARKDPSREGVLQIYNWVGDNFEDGSPDYTNCVTIELGTNINNGILKGKYSDASGTTNYSEVAISKIDNKYIAFGISTLPISNYPVNVVLIQR